jgi:glycosyltransferase involved in cell wall biosynthesis
MPNVSIVMPAFNAEKYISVAINSIIKQTYEDFELIIVNDGSTDQTLDIITGFNDPRIILINNKKNVGLVNSLNIGLKFSNGNFIARMDADDISELDRLEVQLEYCEKYKFDLCGCHWVSIDRFGNTYDSILAPISEVEQLFRFVNGSPFAHGSIIMRRSFILQHNITYEHGYAEDFLLWSKMYKLGAKIGAADKFLFKYRILQTSLSNRNALNCKSDSYKIRFDFIDFYKDRLIESIKNINFANDKIYSKNFEADFVFCLFYLNNFFNLVELYSLLRGISLISIIKGARRYLKFRS